MDPRVTYHEMETKSPVDSTANATSALLVKVPDGLIEELNGLKLTELASTIESLSQHSSKVSQFVHEYDFGDHQINGYRSFLKIIQHYLFEIQAFLLVPAINSGTNPKLSPQVVANMHLLARSLNRHKVVNPKNRERVLSDLLSIGKFFEKQFGILELIRNKEIAMATAKEEDLEDLGDGVLVHPNEKEILRMTLAINEEDLIPFYNSELRNFWLHGASRKLMDLFLTAGLTRIIPYSKSLRMLFDDSIKSSAGANLALNCEVMQQKAMWSIMEHNLYRMIQKLKKISKSLYISTKYIPRQSKCGLLQDGSLDVSGNYPGLASNNSSIECLVIVPEIRMGEDSLIFHCHGGGFLAMSPKGHEPYLAHWCEVLNVPIVCPNYGKAPEKPYPYGIQDLLDAYLFFTSGKDEVKSILGFHPKSIIFTGDSAGGNLALVLTIVLHELSKLQSGSKIIKPASIYLLYPTANSGVEITASRSMCTFDPILNIAAVFSVAQAYNCGVENSHLPQVPWYRQDEEAIEKVIKKIIKRHKEDPFINPLIYDKFHELKNVRCFIQCCEYDPLLDDSIKIAKLWQGPMTLDLVNDHCHGFMMMGGQKAVKTHLETFFKRIVTGFTPIPESNGSSEKANNKL